MRESLIRAGIGINHIVYISSAFFWSAVAFVSASSAAFLSFLHPFPLFVISASVSLSIMWSLFLGVTSGAIVFAIFLYYPNYVASKSRATIDRNLVYITSYMAILSSAGVTPEDTLSSLAKVGEVYGLKVSVKSITKSIEFLGEDTMSALDEESQRTPSREYGNLLQGYIATLREGGDLQSYLLMMSRKFMDSRKRLLSRIISQLSLAGEIFIAALVTLPIVMATVLSIVGFFGGEIIGGLSAPQTMALMNYILVPLIGIGALILIDIIASRW